MLPESEIRKMGIGFIGFGLFFIAFGCFLFMDRALLAMGNVFFLLGVIAVYGIPRSIAFFTSPQRMVGTATFFAGFLLVLKGWCWVGIAIEGFGFVNLWGNYLPTALSFLEKLPLIGYFLGFPFLAPIVARITGKGTNSSEGQLT